MIAAAAANHHILTAVVFWKSGGAQTWPYVMIFRFQLNYKRVIN